MRTISGLLLFLFVPFAFAGEPRAVANAKEVFEKYVKLSHAFDGSVADLYSDEAKIENKRTYPDGQVKVLSLPAPKYKELIRAVMPLAKERGDISNFSDVAYAPEGDAVRVTAKRYSELKQYTSAFSMLVRADASGRWYIVEELSESRP